MGTFTISQDRGTQNAYFIPNGAGCNTDLTPNGEANNYECVDDPLGEHDEDDTYVSTNTDDLLYDLYALPNHTTESGTINYVQIFIRGKSHTYPQAEGGIYKIIITEDNCSNIYKSANIDITTDYNTYYTTWTENPRTAAAWTWSDIDNLQIGVECDSPYTDIIEKTLTIRPNAQGDLAELYPQSCGDAANHQECVDESIPDGYDTFVWKDALVAWHSDLYEMDNHTTETGTITKVTVFAVCADEEAPPPYRQIGDSADGKLGIKIGGTEYWGDEFTVSPDWEVFTKDYESNPSTGIAWTWTNIDDLQCGVKFYRNTSGPYANCTQLYAVVYYKDPGNPDIRTTQCFAKIEYVPVTSECTITCPETISTDQSINIKMLNFWSGNREVYGISRDSKTMVLAGKFYGGTPSDDIECIRDMGEDGSSVSISGLGTDLWDSTFQIKSFGWKKIFDHPLSYDWILELEYNT